MNRIGVVALLVAAVNSAAIASTTYPLFGPHAHHKAAKMNDKPDRFITAGYMIPSVTYNTASLGNTGIFAKSGEARAAAEIPVHSRMLYAAAEVRQYSFATKTSGIYGVDYDQDIRAGIKVLNPKIYVGVSDIQHGTSGAGAARVHGIGYGIEKLPDFDHQISLNGAYYYYANVGGANQYGSESDRGVRYHLGATYTPKKLPVFGEVGYLGDTGDHRSGYGNLSRHRGPYAGLGLHF